VDLRKKKKNLHLTKTWILRFQNWFIINVYGIQPLTKINYSSSKEPFEVKRIFPLNTEFTSYKKKKILIRLSLFVSFICKHQLQEKNYFFF
jgi:hypothetical protein